MQIYKWFGAGNFDELLTSNVIQADPGVMRQKALVVQAKINQMRSAFDSLEYTMNRTSTYWIGEAGDSYREAFHDKKSNIDTILLRLSEHVTDLQKMAEVYADVEKEVEDIANDLPSDVIC